MTEPIYLYHRDALNCIKLLFNNPLFKDDMDYTPHHSYMNDECNVRVYSKWMSSDSCWEMQQLLPAGATLCDVIISSDKTHITDIGGKVAHPVLISLANIGMKVWNKASSHAFLLLTLMLIPEFLHKTP
ncbi:hypothetical protein JVT61DRAFT_9954 [Boletus reticuloceps]|uniref:Uncharacterized protein n=1 Tax=Boletus reticuloceps TaxID=495285 RepID=A0A8I2YGQ3_9AGAM|nr:hypothetical protein JVT61DRAFT_9954 [Boletus reticuloceps]